MKTGVLDIFHPIGAFWENLGAKTSSKGMDSLLDFNKT